VVDAMAAAAGEPLRALRVDGGASANDFLMQFQADVLGAPVERPALLEATAKGAAALAGLAVGFWREVEAIPAPGGIRVFEPALGAARRDELVAGWKRAVERARRWTEPEADA
jgi:glycerol kinase